MHLISANQMTQNTQDPLLATLECSQNSQVNGQILSAAEAWALLREQGLSARDWALQHGFEPTLVYSVLSGRRKCLRGKSHVVAKALGLK